jgi:serine/threonine protein kinase
LSRTVAVKILSDGIVGDPELRARFEREARAVALLDHPHICAVYDVGQQDDVSYLVMQYLEGETLAARLARTNGPLPLPQVLSIGAQLADALEKTHRVGLTHRDLKPANVMLTKSGPKLLDFGLAKIRDASGPISMSGMTRLAAQRPLTVAKQSWTISTEGGSQPRWSPNGRELLYLRRDGTLMSVPVETAPTFVQGAPVPLFKTGLTGVDAYRLDYVPSADGKRILLSTPIINQYGRPAITVVLNWPALLKR